MTHPRKPAIFSFLKKYQKKQYFMAVKKKTEADLWADHRDTSALLPNWK
jgi:hypothetical protein